jgi:hypothetical protein
MTDDDLEKIPIGTTGIALEHIDAGRTGNAYFPKFKKVAKVYAIEEIRQYRDIIIVEANNKAQEHTPEELKYETFYPKGWRRVTEENSLPVTLACVKDDYALIPFTETETCYEIGTKAYEADPTVPWGRTFEAKEILLRSDQNCYIRFDGPQRVQHLIRANAWYTFRRRCSKIYVVRESVNGTLELHAEG